MKFFVMPSIFIVTQILAHRLFNYIKPLEVIDVCFRAPQTYHISHINIFSLLYHLFRLDYEIKKIVSNGVVFERFYFIHLTRIWYIYIYISGYEYFHGFNLKQIYYYNRCVNSLRSTAPTGILLIHNIRCYGS